MATWFPIFTLLLGYSMKALSDWVHHRRTVEREREARKEARREQLSEQRRTFQRQTLLELQTAVFDLARATGATHRQDEMAFRETGKWQKQLLASDWDEKSMLAARGTMMFMVRVRDQELRGLVEEFRNLAGQVTVGIGRDHSNSAFVSMAEVFEKVQRRIGKLLITLDDEDETEEKLLRP